MDDIDAADVGALAGQPGPVFPDTGQARAGARERVALRAEGGFGVEMLDHLRAQSCAVNTLRW